MLWIHWWNPVCELRPACARTRTFLGMSLCLAGISTREDLLGVAGIVRTLGLEPACYGRLLDFFHSPALDLNELTHAWCGLVFRFNPGILRVNGWPVLAVLTHALSSVFALPLACRIHEGTVFSNRDHRTLPDKTILLLDSLDLKEPFYFVADAYYASGKIVRRLPARGNHLVARVKSNSVAYFPAAPPPPHRPRRRAQRAPRVYGEQGVTLRFRVAGLLWRPPGILVRFLVVLHPQRGAILPMCTGPTLALLDIIRIYGLRFKIEVSCKQALQAMGAYAYHFRMAAMTPLRRVSGNQYLHRKSDACRNAVRRKIAAYHPHIQLGLIAQGLLQILSATKPTPIWHSFGSWIRTVRPGLAPSEPVVAIALRNTLPQFLASAAKPSILVKFIRDRLDLSRTEGTSLAA